LLPASERMADAILGAAGPHSGHPTPDGRRETDVVALREWTPLP
jgi:hypothetical protein